MTPTSILNFFFGTNGRLPRVDYIAFIAATWLISSGSFYFLGDHWAVPIGLFLTFPTVCLGIRRWHDFNFRGWWLLLRFVPLPLLYVLGGIPALVLAAQITPLVVLAVEFVVPGTAGANRFGAPVKGLWAWAAGAKPAAAKSFAAPSRPATKAAKPAAKKAKKKKK